MTLSSIARRSPDGLAAPAGGSHERLRANVLTSDHLVGDDTPVQVFGRRRAKAGQLWVYARNRRPWAGSAPLAAVYVFAPHRKSERPAAHLEHFFSVLHVDGMLASSVYGHAAMSSWLLVGHTIWSTVLCRVAVEEPTLRVQMRVPSMRRAPHILGVGEPRRLRRRGFPRASDQRDQTSAYVSSTATRLA